MSRLLSANLARLKKNMLFWVALVLMAAISLFTMTMYIFQSKEWAIYGEELYFDSCYFVLSPFIGLFITVVIVFFLGVDYSDGTIRNKITSGHTRTEIYSANFIICILVSALFNAVWLAGGLIGLPFMECEQEIGQMLLYTLTSFFFSFSTGAIAAMIGMLISNKAISVTTAILQFFGLLMVTSYIILQLDEPEMIQYMQMTDEGMQMVGPVTNPQYIGGALRVVLECVVNTLPSGQAVMLSNMELEHTVFDIVVSAFLTVIVSAIGLLIFNKKDIR